MTITVLLALAVQSRASTRTVEFPFALSSDRKSEFAARFAALSPGRIVVEASWGSAGRTGPVSLTLILLRPDGTEAARKIGMSGMRADYVVPEPEIERFTRSRNFKWTARLVNDADEDRREVSGRLRISLPAVATLLEDTQFTLLGSGNAQEIAFVPPAPGRILVEATWQSDSTDDGSIPRLTVSLIHPAQSRTHARRQGMSPIRVEHQVTEPELDRGSRWVVRVQNDGLVRINGRLKVLYTPGL
jgi:hypothetical protein